MLCCKGLRSREAGGADAQDFRLGAVEGEPKVGDARGVMQRGLEGDAWRAHEGGVVGKSEDEAAVLVE